MTTIIAIIPDHLLDEVRQFIESLGGKIIAESESSAEEISELELELVHRAEKDNEGGRVNTYTSHRGILGRRYFSFTAVHTNAVKTSYPIFNPVLFCSVLLCRNQLKK